MAFQFTAVYVDGEDGWIVVFVEEFPNIVTQGKTIEQARERVIDAAPMILRAHREIAGERTAGRDVFLRETLTVDDVGEFDAVYVAGGSGYIVAFVEQYPGVVCQGTSIEEARADVIDAIQVMLRIGRKELRESTAGRDILLRESLTLDEGDAN